MLFRKIIYTFTETKKTMKLTHGCMWIRNLTTELIISDAFGGLKEFIRQAVVHYVIKQHNLKVKLI